MCRMRWGTTFITHARIPVRCFLTSGTVANGTVASIREVASGLSGWPVLFAVSGVFAGTNVIPTASASRCRLIYVCEFDKIPLVRSEPMTNEGVLEKKGVEYV